MKSVFILILLSPFFLSAQNFYCTETLQANGCTIELINKSGVKTGELTVSELIYFKDPSGNWILTDGKNTYKLYTSCLITPDYIDVGVFVDSVRDACQSSGSDYSSKLDSIYNLIASINFDTTQLDTNNLNSLLVAIGKLDSTQVDTNNLNNVELLLSLINSNAISIGDTIINRLDSLLILLQPSETDTVKVLVYDTYIKDLSGIRDTFYNCNGISFAWLSTATGSITIIDDAGNNTILPAGENLPFLQSDGLTFYTSIEIDATGATGFLVNAKGCTDTSGNPCVSIKPLEDCSTGEIIETCNGWESVSGVWQTSSGCWNTGQ